MDDQHKYAIVRLKKTQMVDFFSVIVSFHALLPPFLSNICDPLLRENDRDQSLPLYTNHKITIFLFSSHQ